MKYHVTWAVHEADHTLYRSGTVQRVADSEAAAERDVRAKLDQAYGDGRRTYEITVKPA